MTNLTTKLNKLVLDDSPSEKLINACAEIDIESCFDPIFEPPLETLEEWHLSLIHIFSTRGLKADAVKYGELIFDVNSAYFHNHGGYEYAKQFYTDAYKAAVEIVGGEQYILCLLYTSRCV